MKATKDSGVEKYGRVDSSNSYPFSITFRGSSPDLVDGRLDFSKSWTFLIVFSGLWANFAFGRS